MTDYYVRSGDGSDADSGVTWALAKSTLAGALAIAAPGDRIFVSQAHAETQATALTLTSPGTAANPAQILCGDDSAAPPTALATTATISTTGTSNITFGGFASCYGITFVCGSGAGSPSVAFSDGNAFGWALEACSVQIGASGSSATINLGTNSSTPDDALLEWTNVTVSFANAGQRLVPRASRFVWRSTAGALLGTLPTTLLIPTNTPYATAVIQAVDLSALTSGKSLVSMANATGQRFVFISCKLGSGVALVTGTHVGPGGVVVEAYNCDSADTNYRNERYEYQGFVVTVTDIVRSSGASNGTTAFAWKMTSGANCRFISPLTSLSRCGMGQQYRQQNVHGVLRPWRECCTERR